MTVFRTYPGRCFYRLAWIYRILTRRFTRQVAVIGSLGKTTCSRAAASALGQLTYRKYYRNLKTYAARRILEVPPWQKYAVTEIGIDGPGQMEQFAGMVQPDIVIVTAIASEHNRSLKNLETTALKNPGCSVISRRMALQF